MSDATEKVMSRHTFELSMDSVHKAHPVLKEQDSRQAVDPFSGMYVTAASGFENTIIEPMYSPMALNRYASASGILRTCIDAMATNIDGFGYTLEYIGAEGEQSGVEAQEEYQRVMGLLDHPNGEYSLIELRRRMRMDTESCGYGVLEILKNPDDGFPDSLYHVPSHTVRMTTVDRKASEARRYMPRPGADGDNMVKTTNRFRRFVQISDGQTIYFRELGDQRPISHKTGRPTTGKDPDELASDMIMDAVYTPGCRYGTPRWIGELRSVLGLQESQGMNLSFFKDNGIPAMMLFILGGGMGDQSIARFEEGIRANRGSGMANKVTVVEVESNIENASIDGQVPRPDVKPVPLSHERQTDAFFQEYEKSAGKNIRSSFRIPALFTGLTEEVRMAVADASLIVAENQVFGPERARVDDLFNYRVLTYNGRPMRYWRLRSNPPRITNNEELMNAISVFDDAGAMTPNIVISIANEMFNMSIPSVDDDWGDMPFVLKTGNTAVPTPAAGGTDDAGAAEKRARSTKSAAFQKPRHRDAGRAPGATMRTMGKDGIAGRSMKAGSSSSDTQNDADYTARDDAGNDDAE